MLHAATPLNFASANTLLQPEFASFNAIFAGENPLDDGMIEDPDQGDEMDEDLPDDDGLGDEDIDDDELDEDGYEEIDPESPDEMPDPSNPLTDPSGPREMQL
jgi:hypothetical protein